MRLRQLSLVIIAATVVTVGAAAIINAPNANKVVKATAEASPELQAKRSTLESAQRSLEARHIEHSNMKIKADNLARAQKEFEKQASDRLLEADKALFQAKQLEKKAAATKNAGEKKKLLDQAKELRITANRSGALVLEMRNQALQAGKDMLGVRSSASKLELALKAERNKVAQLAADLRQTERRSLATTRGKDGQKLVNTRDKKQM